MVPVIGVEPIRYRYHWILSPARLPIPSHRQMSHLRGTLVLYHSLKIKSRAFENKFKIYFCMHCSRKLWKIIKKLFSKSFFSGCGQSPRPYASGFSRGAHQQKEKGALLCSLVVYHIRESDCRAAASAESAAPYVSELPTAFVRFSNPNSRQDEEKG